MNLAFVVVAKNIKNVVEDIFEKMGYVPLSYINYFYL
jgi:hypothetical protein